MLAKHLTILFYGAYIFCAEAFSLRISEAFISALEVSDTFYAVFFQTGLTP